MPYTIERPGEHAGLAQHPQVRYQMDRWYRIVDPSGATIAYCPDAATAEIIRAAVEAHEKENP